jgi:YVTN family beta-propeller protein
VVGPRGAQAAAAIPSGPDGSFDLSKDGKRLYVSNEETAEMSEVDLASGKVTRTVKVGEEPEGVTLRPDGKVVFVTSEQTNQVVAVDVKKMTVVGRIATGPRPRAVVLTHEEIRVGPGRERRGGDHVRRDQDEAHRRHQDRARRQDAARAAPDGRRALGRP